MRNTLTTSALGGSGETIKRHCVLTKTWRIVKITAVIMLICSLHVTARSLSQTITLSGKDIPLQKVFREIERQSGYTVFYNQVLIADLKPVTVHAKDEPLNEFLDKTFHEVGLEYVMENRSIILRKKEIVKNDASSGPPIDVKGRVVDEKGNPIEGVSVRVKGTNNGTSTNANGEFFLKAVPEDGVLLFTAVNVEDIEWKVGGKSEMIVNVKTKIRQEQEVEVLSTGYQDLPKERATGSFVKIDNALFNRSVSSNVLDRVYYVTSSLLSTSSEKNGSADIPPLMIRGSSTINANKAPLIVVDNFPYDGNINNINPNDIESITILRDAAASSIWGIRAGNGVIVIVTKKGKFNQASKITSNSNVTVIEKPNLGYIPLMSSADAIAFEKEQFSSGLYDAYDDQYPQFGYFPVIPQSLEILLAERRGAIGEGEANNQLQLMEHMDMRKELEKYFMRRAVNQQYAVNFSGGSNTYNYLVSAGFDMNRPNDLKNVSRRLTLRMNNTWRPLKNLQISGEIACAKMEDINHAISFVRLIPGNNQVSPYSRLKDNNGLPLAIPRDYRLAYVDTATFPQLKDWHFIPLNEINDNVNEQRSTDVRVNTNARLTILPHLYFNVYYQYQNITSRSVSVQDANSYYVRTQVNKFMRVNANGQVENPFPEGDALDLTNQTFTSWNLRSQMNYEQTWAEHQVVLLAGSEIRETKTDLQSNNIIGYNSATSISPVVDRTTVFPLRPFGAASIGGGQGAFRNRLSRNGSYFANGSYTFKNTYLLTASGRLDQANFFGVKANQRIVPLWSLGLGWIVTEQTKQNHVGPFEFLKVRMSYGANGNADPSASSFTTIYYGNTWFIPTQVVSAQIIAPPNAKLRWEKIKMVNAGIDFSLRNNRLSGTLDVYRKESKDLLGPVQVDPTTGVTSYIGNNSSMQVKGLDLQLNGTIIDSRLKWVTTLLLSWNKDKVTQYEYGFEVIPRFHVQSTPIIGKSLYQLSSYRWAGLDPENGDPMIVVADTASNYANYLDVTDNDIKYHGTRTPQFSGGVRNIFNWNRFSFSFNTIFRLNYFFRASSVNYSNLLTFWSTHADFSNRWKAKGDEGLTNVPSMPLSPNSTRDEIYERSDILVEKGDHIRLQDIQLSYDFKDRHIFDGKAFHVQLYAFVNNVGILWRANDKGIDPDAYQFGSWPNQRSVSIGLSANF